MVETLPVTIIGTDDSSYARVTLSKGPTKFVGSYFTATAGGSTCVYDGQYFIENNISIAYGQTSSGYCRCWIRLNGNILECGGIGAYFHQVSTMLVAYS